MLLQRAALASSSVRASRAVAYGRLNAPVIRHQAIAARKHSPSYNTPPARAADAGLSAASSALSVVGAGLSVAGAGLAAFAPAPVRITMIVRVPAISCINHSGDSQEEPADSNAPAAREVQPAGCKGFAESQEQPTGSKTPASTAEEPADSTATAESQEQPAGSKAPSANQEKPPDSEAPANSQEQPADSKAPAAREVQPADRQVLAKPAGFSRGRRTFFSRDIELRQLEIMANDEPDMMHMILGPRSCGKTGTFVEFQRRMAAQQVNVIMLDMRKIPASTPAAFVKMALLELAQAMPETTFREAAQRLLQAAPIQLGAGTIVSALAQIMAGLAGVVKLGAKDTLAAGQGGDSTTDSTARGTTNVTLDLKNATDVLQRVLTPGTQPLQGDKLVAVFQAMEALLAAYSAGEQQGERRLWPVLIIDEANALMEWRDDHPKELADLLRFLVAISKQQMLCHVILATSEWGFMGWLEEAIGKSCFVTEVIGDFPEAEARKYFEWELQRRGLELDEATWEKVYEVGGGNAGFLTPLAAHMGRAKLASKDVNELNWDAALEYLASPIMEDTEQHADGGDQLGWSHQQYIEATKKLLQSEHHAVPRKEMALLLGLLDKANSTPDEQRVAGQQVLRKMVAANALAVRPRRNWARDVPVEAFKGTGAVVTAPSAVSLHCMRRLLQAMEKDSLEATRK